MKRPKINLDRKEMIMKTNPHLYNITVFDSGEIILYQDMVKVSDFTREELEFYIENKYVVKGYHSFYEDYYFTELGMGYLKLMHLL
jgi:hypothetical protein